MLPIAYSDDRVRAEQILLDVAESHTTELRTRGEAAIQSMMRSYAMAPAGHGARELKDAMSRDILGAFDEAGIGIASATYDIVGMPPLRVEVSSADASTKGKAP